MGRQPAPSEDRLRVAMTAGIDIARQRPYRLAPGLQRTIMPDKKHIAFSGRLAIIGFGSIGQGVLPLLLRHIDIRPDQITIVTAEPRGQEVAAEYGVRFVETALTRQNYRAVLEDRLGRDDFLLNVSVDVSSVALIELLPGKGGALSRHLHRTLARRLYRPRPSAVGALQLRAARERAGAARPGH